jgi:hypothetical protein
MSVLMCCKMDFLQTQILALMFMRRSLQWNKENWVIPGTPTVYDLYIINKFHDDAS